MTEHDRALWDKNCSVALPDFLTLLEESRTKKMTVNGQALLTEWEKHNVIEVSEDISLAPSNLSESLLSTFPDASLHVPDPVLDPAGPLPAGSNDDLSID